MSDHQSNPNGFDHSEIREAHVRKLQAEAQRADAERLACEAEAAANTRRLDAEAGRLLAERTQLELESEKLRLETSDLAIKNRQNVREEREKMALNYFHNILHFRDSVNSGTVAELMKYIDVWRRTKEAEGIEPKDQRPIHIIFTSPGGSIIDGLVLYDYLQDLRRRGHKVITGTYGMAASMAGILLQAGDVRWMGRESWLMIHEASFAAVGKTSEAEDTVEWIKAIQRRILDIFANRAAGAAPDRCPRAENHDHKWYVKLIEKEWKRKDWFLNSDEAIKYGFVDLIDSPQE